MKKIILFFLLFSMISTSVFSKEINLIKINSNVYNELLKGFTQKEVTLSYETKKDVLYLTTKDIFGYSVVVFDKEERIKAIDIFKKYLKWNAKAIKLKVTLEKKINELDLKRLWSFNDEWYTSNAPAKVVFTFFSQSKKHHQLVWAFAKAKTSVNQFLENKIPQLYFEIDEVKKMITNFDDKNIQKLINKNNKKKSIEDEFK